MYCDLKMSEYVTTTTFERHFRSLLVRLVEELGDEKFKNFCFILSVPEAIRERHRADVLWHLLEQGKLSPRRPRDIVRLLRDDLHRDDLATEAESAIEKFEDVCQPIQETVSQPQDTEPLEVQSLQDIQPRLKRVPKSPRPYAVYFPDCMDHDGPGLQQTVSSARFSQLEPVEEEPQNDDTGLREDSAFYNPEETYSPNTAKELWKYVHSKEAQKYWGERTMHDMLRHFHYVSQSDKVTTMLPKDYKDFDVRPDNRHSEKNSLGVGTHGHQTLSRSASNVSKASVRSSGYYSIRDSKISVDSLYLQDETSTSEPIAALELPEQSRSRSASLTSFKSAPESWSCSSRRSSTDDTPDDDYQSCNSIESQISEDHCSNEAILQTHEPRDRRDAPVRATLTPILGEMRLKRKDVLKHIEKKKPETLYSSNPFPSEKAYQFELRLYPTNFQQDGSALYIDTKVPVDLAGLLPINIKVCVCATDVSKASQNEKKACINSLEKIVDSLPQHSDCHQSCFASFPKIVSHEQLLAVKTDFIAVQVVMEHVGH